MVRPRVLHCFCARSALAPIAQWIEHRPPEPGAGVRVALGAPSHCEGALQAARSTSPSTELWGLSPIGPGLYEQWPVLCIQADLPVHIVSHRVNTWSLSL